MDRFTFRRIILNTSAEKLKEFKDFLKKVRPHVFKLQKTPFSTILTNPTKVPLLKALSKVEREKVAEALDEIFLEAVRIV